MKLIITEKPSVAKSIGGALGINQMQDSYLTDNSGSFITWCYGHLAELAMPEYYGWKEFKLEYLPMIPEHFHIQPKDDPGVVKQLSVIKNLVEKVDEIICATDAGREGELIFRYTMIAGNIELKNKNLKRLWISSLTDKAIKDGFDNLKPLGEYDNLYEAGRLRSEADWLVGLNATRALTIKSPVRQVLSLGRVQTPTLSLICQRYLENKHFKSEAFFTPVITLTKSGILFSAKYAENFKTAEQANTIFASLTDNLKVGKVETKNTKIKPPLLFDLTQLQRHCNDKFNYTADETLQYAQSLYENKLISYPRTSSQYISDDIFPEIKKIIAFVGSRMENLKNYTDKLINENLSTFCVDSSKVTDHHALLPTGEGTLTLLQQKIELANVFKAICIRTVEAFSQPAEIENTKVFFPHLPLYFQSSGSVILVPGFKDVASALPMDLKKQSDTQEENEEDQKLPKLQVDDICSIITKNSLKGTTKPKPILTESSLLQLMETAGKLIEDEQAAKAIKECGLGTPATRAGIIENIIHRKYVLRDKKKLIPTDLGLSVYELLKNMDISNPTLTGNWELKLNKVADGNMPALVFTDEIKSYTREIVDVLLNAKIDFKVKTYNCPKCGKVLYDNNFTLTCQDKDNCGFVLWRTIGGKNLSDTEIEKLLKLEITPLKGLKTKEGKLYDGNFFLDKENDFKFSFARDKGADTSYKCPKCGKAVLEDNFKLYCEDNQCNFKIYREVAKKKLTAKHLTDLLKKGITAKIEGFVAVKSNKTFNAILFIDKQDDFKIKFKFDMKK